MNPWNIIGWAVVGIAALLALIVLYIAALVWIGGFAIRRRARKCLNIKPRVGQRWQQWFDNAWDDMWVISVSDWGIGIRAIGGTTWSESWDQWRERIKNRNAYLYEDAPQENE